jgi:hypothetical protein
MDPESLQDLKDQQSRIANIQNSVTSGDFKKFAVPVRTSLRHANHPILLKTNINVE